MHAMVGLPPIDFLIVRARRAVGNFLRPVQPEDSDKGTRIRLADLQDASDPDRPFTGSAEVNRAAATTH